MFWKLPLMLAGLVGCLLAVSFVDRDRATPPPLQSAPSPPLESPPTATEVGVTLLTSPGALAIHAEIVKDFAELPGFGTARILPLIDMWRSTGIEFDGQPYVISGLELIGLEDPDSPAAYLTRKGALDGTPGPATTRALTEFEQLAVASVRAGAELVASLPPEQPRLLGALHASRSCAGCHDVPAGTVLGAFSYELRVPTPEEELLGTPRPRPTHELFRSDPPGPAKR